MAPADADKLVKFNARISIDSSLFGAITYVLGDPEDLVIGISSKRKPGLTNCS